MTDEEPRKIPKGILKTIDRYVARLQRGEKLMRDATGRVQWSSGKRVGRRSIGIMLEAGIIRPLDTDLFGDYSRGQTIGLSA
jgi:tetrahydromethanopterin S-methyltransferase subunit G